MTIIDRLSRKIIRFQQEVNQNKNESKRVDDWNNDSAVFEDCLLCENSNGSARFALTIVQHPQILRATQGCD